jgi:hypothetical protein
MQRICDLAISIGLLELLIMGFAGTAAAQQPGASWRPEPLGPSELSAGVFACLLGVWLIVQWQRRRVSRP